MWPHGVGQLFRLSQRRGAFPGFLYITIFKLKRTGIVLGTQGKGLPFYGHSIAIVFFNFLQAHGRWITPGSKVIRELNNFDWSIHSHSPVFPCNIAMTSSCTRPFEITAVPV